MTVFRKCTAAALLVFAILSTYSSATSNISDLKGIIRLASSHRTQGRLELLVNGTWGTVSGNVSWGIKEARVACRMLDLPNATQAVRGGLFGPGEGPVLFSEFQCTGTEQSLLDCPREDSIGCAHAQDAGVVCGDPKDDVFLVGGLTPNQGNVIVLLNGTFGAIHGVGWDREDADVVCRMKGLPRASNIVKEAFFGVQYGMRTLLNDVQCLGNESSLFDCPMKTEVIEHGLPAGVVCGNLEVKLQLVGGRTPSEGVVEVAFGHTHGSYNKTWTSLAITSSWSINSARVVCRMLGFADASFAVDGRMFNDTSEGYNAMITDVDCTGTETAIGECTYRLGFQALSRKVGVICGQRNNTVPVRLINGTLPSSGLVQLKVSGTWGPVCDITWNVKHARVVCRLLGYPDAFSATVGSVFGQSSGIAVLGIVRCRGDERSLFDCDGYGFTPCDGRANAGVFCEEPAVHLRLVGRGSTANQGRLELSIAGINGTVCNLGWDSLDASVVCRMLGRGSTGYPVKNTAFGPGDGAILLRNVRCEGNEVNLLSCLHDVMGRDTDCNHDTDVGVVCGDTAVRLLNGSSWNNGRVQVQIDGIWGAAIGPNSALASLTVCRWLGVPGFSNPVFDHVYGEDPRTVGLLGNVSCDNTQFPPTLLDCSFEYKPQNREQADMCVACGPPTANVTILELSASSPLSAASIGVLFDNSENTCFILERQTDPSINVRLGREVYIHSVSVTFPSKSDITPVLRVRAHPSHGEDAPSVCYSGVSRFFVTGGMLYVCDPPVFGRNVSIEMSGHNKVLSLCSLNVFTFDKIRESLGVLQERWPKQLIDRSEGQLLKYNTFLIRNRPVSVFITNGFPALARDYDLVPIRATAYFQISGMEAGRYHFLVSCDDECEMWLSEVSEEEFHSDVTYVDYIIKAQRRSPFNVFNKYPEQTSKAQYLSPCRLYYLEAYLLRSQESHMSIRIAPEFSVSDLREIPAQRLFWTAPGKRELLFQLKNVTAGEIQAELGSPIELSASYRFCCKGLFCPEYGIHLSLTVGRDYGGSYYQQVVVNENLTISCETRALHVTLPAVFLPRDYAIRIVYSFPAELKRSHQRHLGNLRILERTLTECNFSNGLCEGWFINDNPSFWALNSTEKALYMERAGTATLGSGTIPWMPSDQDVQICLNFDYKLASDDHSSIEVLLVRSSNERVLWSLHGFHGNMWKRGNVSWLQQRNSQVVFSGKAASNASATGIAIRDIQITTEDCLCTPVIAEPGYKCLDHLFTCNNGECVTKTSRCNGMRDSCVDGSDESGCTCGLHEFQCSSGECIEVATFCDGKKDCGDRFDETHCGSPCPEVSCPDGTCMTWSEACSNSGRVAFDDDDNNNGDVKRSCPVSSVVCETQGRDSAESQSCNTARIRHCGFEDALCGLNNQGWTRKVAKFSALHKIVPEDHTLLTPEGSYLFLWSTDGRTTGNLTTRWSSRSQSLCLQFWYKLRGDSSIAVYKATNNTKSLVAVWSEEAWGSWRFAQTSLNDDLYMFQAVIDGSALGDESVIALDDLNIAHGNCSTIIKQRYPGCSFSDDTCEWKMGQNWKIYKDWKKPQDRNSSYLYYDGASENESNITSPQFNPLVDGWRCFGVWFWSDQKYYKRLITVRLVYSDSVIASLWSYRSVVNNGVYVQLPIPHIDTLVKISIVVQKSQVGPKIAFKNATFTKEACKPITPIAECYDYALLDSVERRVNNTNGTNCDDDLNGHTTWYRITGDAGNQMPTDCVPRGHCGSAGTIHLDGEHPRGLYELSKLDYCLSTNSCCSARENVMVRNCGSYFVYKGIVIAKNDCPAQVCTVFKEITPVQDRSSEWESWMRVNDSTLWRTRSENDLTDSSNQDLENWTASNSSQVELLPGSSIYVSFKCYRAEVEEMTLCLWVKISNVTLDVESYSPVSHLGNYGLRIIENSLTVLIANVSRSVNVSLTGDTWYHVCFTWKSSWGLWHLFLDGQIVGHGQHLADMVKVHEGYSSIEGRGSMSLVTRSTNGILIPKASVKLTGFNIWPVALSGDLIGAMSYACLDEHGTFVSWSSLYEQLQSKEEVKTEPVTCLQHAGPSLSLISKINTNVSDSFESLWFNRTQGTNAQCLAFKYRIVSNERSSLILYQTIDYPGIPERPVWIDYGNNDKVWRTGKVWIPTSSAYKIRVQGNLFDDGFVSISGMYYSSDYCDLTPSTAMKACRIIMTTPSGEIFSPNYPGYYPGFMSCTWRISVPVGNVIRLTFIMFDLEDDPLCARDFLELMDGGQDSRMSIGRFCGNRYPLSIMTATSRLKIVFTSTAFSGRQGFRLRYDAVVDHKLHCIADCPPEITCYRSTSGVVVYGTTLFAIPKRLPESTAVVLFAKNDINDLKATDFSGLREIKYLDLSWNKILRVDKNAFKLASNLRVLKLNHNPIKFIDPEVFQFMPNLQKLDLGEMALSAVPNVSFLINLTVLSLRQNLISNLPESALQTNVNLTFLYLQDNSIKEIPDGFFKSLKKLRVLYLSGNQIKRLTERTFKGLASLERLYLDNNHLVESDVDQDAFSGLPRLKFLKLDSLVLCCYAMKESDDLVCESPGNRFSSCSDLLKYPTLQVSIWIIGFLALVGNFYVLLYWNFLTPEDHHHRAHPKARVQSFLLTNLAVADLLMGVYLWIIAIQGVRWTGEYFRYDVQWRTGMLCQVAGAISTLSSEVSIVIMLIITADRLNCIVFDIRARPLGIKPARVICAFVWLLFTIMSFLPMVFTSYFYDKSAALPYFGRTSVCLPLAFSSARPHGWGYSFAIFIVFNSAAFLFILVAYVSIFLRVRTSSRAVRSTLKRDSALAVRVALIIVTDFCCWMPIIVISIMAFLNKFHDPSQSVMAWIAVFVLPINSSINPLLYTLSNPHARQTLAFWKHFRIRFCKVRCSSSAPAPPNTPVTTLSSTQAHTPQLKRFTFFSGDVRSHATETRL
ncbi:uncharacterized protein LOC5515157 isoform X2 [Nematostella vectensis]|uniref:uncharacterized protein LOC5515157 isoform X2 n=1 Tax=Nematostella vectensis TaxID=45351 RepID=UPI002076F281|nr:uncharacterized protein LOC5515157 isoform X2 [Nematostella vectensis]